ncbi:MAG: 50S ribosomal protein L28 [Kiritimatiellae bacterium]|nr:50S ribosomal protein L28 [Kiritimatiellia bacterium]
MSRVCAICGKGPSVGNVVVRKGSPKYKGGIGLHTTGITKRRFLPNLQTVRAADAKGNVKRICVCTRCIKNGKVTKA